MARRRRWRAVVVAVGAVASAALPACSPASSEVVVAGLDRNGTPVVAAERCGGTWGRLEAVVVRDLGAPGAPILWQIEDADASAPTTEARPRELAPPPTDPLLLGPVALVAVGEPAPTGWVVTTPLEGALPARGRLRVEVHDHLLDSTPSEVLTIDLDGGRDRYDYVADDSSGSRVAGAQAGAVIEDECADTDTFDDGRFALVAGGGGVVVLLLAVVIGVVTARQYRRAGQGPTRA